MKTTHTPPQDTVRQWYIIDAGDLPLGRIAVRAADVLRGKHKPTYSPHIDAGDGVIVINAQNLVLTGAKSQQKFYAQHSKYAGGLKVRPVSSAIENRPEYVIRHAIAGMVPKNRLKRQILERLRIYEGDQHDLEAQKPLPLFPSHS